jgi:tyrosyl-tRNA synthetase
LDRHRALEKTLAKIRLDDKPEDSDDDVFEFEDAKVEETEDKLVLEFNKKQDFLSKEEIEMITQEVSELDISRDILMMVSRRHMSKNNLKTINEVAEDREESESLSNISQNEIDEKNRKTGLKMMFA